MSFSTPAPNRRAPDLSATGLQVALDCLVALIRAGDLNGAELIVRQLTSDLTQVIAAPAPLVSAQLLALLLPPLMDTWFYLRQSRCDLAGEYAALAREAVGR